MERRLWLLVGAWLALWAVALVGVPLAAAWAVRARLVPVLEARLGRRVQLGDVRVGSSRVVLRDVRVGGGDGGAPDLVVVPRIEVRLRLAALLRGVLDVPEVIVQSPRVLALRGGPADNVSDLISRLRERRRVGGGGEGGQGRLRLGRVWLKDGALFARDQALGEVRLGALEGQLAPGDVARVTAREAVVELRAGPRAQAAQIAIEVPLEGLRPGGLPSVSVEGGAASPLRGLSLTGIHGTFQPDPANAHRGLLELAGSYGGADAELWRARGWLEPAAREGELKLRASRFKLAQLDSVIKNQLVDAKEGEADGRFDVRYEGDRVTFDGALHLAGLTVAHVMLAPVAVPRIGFDARVQGEADLAARRLDLKEASVDFRRVHASLSAVVEKRPSVRPRIAATFKVRPVPCQTALEALPPELVPMLRGFRVQGTFSTDLHLAVDLGDLEKPIDLGGQVGIEGCKVVEAPEHARIERLQQTFEQTVQTEAGKWLTFFAGPEDPDYVPYAELSPHLVNSIMTTEDSGFFRHRGFIPSEFRSALQQNLQKGYFRLGASSITMQMVKNVLLSREKTLSRKLQELFLTWYLEMHLTKERILEIYFNVIEFGPGIYGIGRAARHYFGKTPKELLPQEAAFFSSILPSPKRRYVQYCHADGKLDAKWDAYVKRILRRIHERGRITDEEYQLAISTPIQFDRQEAMPEKECVAMVKRLVPGPPPK